MHIYYFTIRLAELHHTMEITLCIVFVLILLHLSIVNSQIYDVLKFGAKGDGTTDDSEAFVEAWKAMCGSGGKAKTLLVPSNKTFLLQPLEFQGPCKSPYLNVTFNGNIVAPIKKSAWSADLKLQRWISFQNIIGLTIAGLGTIDGRGSSFWEPGSSAASRPTQLHFSGCKDLQISGITSLNSPRNHIGISGCNNVKVWEIKLKAPHDSPNTDGINISTSSNIDIYDTVVGTGDDCIAMNNGSVNINITRMNCGPGHGISVGSLGKHGEEAMVENIQVTNCSFFETDNGVRIKTWQNGKGYARNIIFKNIRVTKIKNPIIIDQNYVDHGSLDVEESAVAISNVTFSDIMGTSQENEIMKIDCSKVTYCKDIVLDKIDIITIDGDKPIVKCSNVHVKENHATGEADGCPKLLLDFNTK